MIVPVFGNFQPNRWPNQKVFSEKVAMKYWFLSHITLTRSKNQNSGHKREFEIFWGLHGMTPEGYWVRAQSFFIDSQSSLGIPWPAEKENGSISVEQNVLQASKNALKWHFGRPFPAPCGQDRPTIGGVAYGPHKPSTHSNRFLKPSDGCHNKSVFPWDSMLKRSHCFHENYVKSSYSSY